jgi:hypothetical protein
LSLLLLLSIIVYYLIFVSFFVDIKAHAKSITLLVLSQLSISGAQNMRDVSSPTPPSPAWKWRLRLHDIAAGVHFRQRAAIFWPHLRPMGEELKIIVGQHNQSERMNISLEEIALWYSNSNKIKIF